MTDPRLKKKYHVVRPHLRIDQECALEAALAHYGITAKDVTKFHYRDDADVPGGIGDVVVIDVDRVMRWNETSFGCALALQLDSCKKAVRNRYGSNALCKMLTANNGKVDDRKGGYLKSELGQEFRSFAWMLYYVQRVNFPGTSDPETSERRWIEAFQDIPRVYYAHAAKYETDHPGVDEDMIANFSRAMPELARKLSVRAFARRWVNRPEGLLTLTGYIIALYDLMTDAEWRSGGEQQLKRIVEFWTLTNEACRELVKHAKGEAVKIAAAAEIYDGPLGGIAWVENDFDEATPYLWKQPSLKDVDVIVSRRKSGNIAIMTRNGANIATAALSGVLSRRECGLWSHQEHQGKGESPMVLNSGKKVMPPPTALSKEELLALIGEHLKRKPGPVAPQRDGHRSHDLR